VELRLVVPRLSNEQWFFETVNTEVLEQESDAMPLPRTMRTRVAPFVSDEWKHRIFAKRGVFLFIASRST
jgi:hypothetical protein